MRAEDGSIRLRCDYCGHEARLGSEVVAAGHEYRRGVNEQASRAEEQALIARRYADLSGGDATGRVAPVNPVSGTVCRSCGAPTSFQVGAMVSHCTYCGASLLANDATRARGLGEAARAFRSTRLEALKSERHFATGLGKKVSFLAIYPAIAAIALPAIASVFVVMSSTDPDAMLQALAFAGASVLAGAVVAGISVWRGGVRKRAEDAVQGVVARYGGRVVRGVGIGAWMNTHWADTYDVYDLSASFDAHAAACTVDGFPVLVIVHPLRSAGTPFIEILLSAWYEGRSESGLGPETRGDATARRFVNEQGFQVRNGPSGLHASMRGAACRKRLGEGIDFGGTLGALAGIAVAQGGRPDVA